MASEVCENCGRGIGKLETACVYQDNVVCKECYEKLGSKKNSLIGKTVLIGIGLVIGVAIGVAMLKLLPLSAQQYVKVPEIGLQINAPQVSPPENLSQFFTAIGEDNLAKVKSGLAVNPQWINAFYYYYETSYTYDLPLHMAVKNNAIHVAKFLIEKGANVNANSRWFNSDIANYSTPLDDAVLASNTNSHVEMIKLLLENGASARHTLEGVIEERRSHGRREKDQEVMALLLQYAAKE
jgi:ankyrin repeat protein